MVVGDSLLVGRSRSDYFFAEVLSSAVVSSFRAEFILDVVKFAQKKTMSAINSALKMLTTAVDEITYHQKLKFAAKGKELPFLVPPCAD